MVRRLVIALCAAALPMLAFAPAKAASVSRSYNYFSIGGSTFEDIEEELNKRGPEVSTTGRRHPGATQMEFSTRISYGETGNGCRIVDANVSVKAKVILPRWRHRGRAEADVRIFWDTLSSDIKRHEESHIVIARTHARELEMALTGLYPQGSCEEAASKAKALTQRILAKHDREQDRFDRVEGINFGDRIMRLLHYRMQRIESGDLPG